MEKTLLKRAFVLMIAAQLMAVACGDGGKKRRTPINRAGANGQKTTPQGKTPQTPGSSSSPTGAPDGGTPGRAGAPGTPDPAARKDEDITAKSQKISQIEKELERRSDGQPMTAQQIEEGIYSLDSVTSQVKYIDSQKGEDLLAINVRKHNNGDIRSKQLSETVGLASVADTGRNLIVPVQFYVQGMNGQAWQPKRGESASELLLKTALEIKPGEVELNDSFVPGGQVRQDAVSIIQTLGTAVGNIDQQAAYEGTDFDGKKVYVRARKSNDGKLRLLVTIMEKGEEVATDAKSQIVMVRTLVFEYSRAPLKKKAEEIEQKREANEPQNLPVTTET